MIYYYVTWDMQARLAAPWPGRSCHRRQRADAVLAQRLAGGRAASVPRTTTSTALKAIMVGSLRDTIAVTRTGRVAASSNPRAGRRPATADDAGSTRADPRQRRDARHCQHTRW
jgi:hypothetical protein